MSACFSWAQQFASAAADRRAQRQARAALEDLRRGYEKLVQLDLPRGGSRSIVGLSQCLSDLETLVPDAAALQLRPWLLALPIEQAQWATKAANGYGTLLRRQVCKAAEGSLPTDWNLGTLAISDAGLLFESLDIPGETRLSVGLVQWRQITCLTRGDAEKDLMVTWGGSGRSRDLQLKLSIAQDAEWLEELWAMSGSDTAIASQKLASIKLTKATLIAKELSEGSEHASSTCGETDHFDADLPLHRPPFAQSSPIQEPLRERALSTLSNFESPWYMAIPDGVPNMDVPAHLQPLCVDVLRDATLDSVAAVLEADDWVFPKFLADFHGASEFDPCKWANSSRVQGTAVRVLNFTMPLPQDVPKAVRMLINLPDATRITNTYRLRKSADEITLIVQVASPGVPFGENFRIQELNSFRRLPGGGVEARKWVEVLWIVAMPWGLGPVKTFAEKKVMDDYIKGAAPLASYLNDAACKIKETSAPREAAKTDTSGTPSVSPCSKEQLGSACVCSRAIITL